MIRHHIQNKYLKIALRAVAVIVVLIFVVLVIVDIYIHTHKEQITQKIRTLIGNSVQGEITIREIDVSLLASFPYAGINVYDVNVLDSQYHRPLLRAGYVSCRISFLQLLNPHPEIAKLIIKDGSFHFFTDTSGYTNAYLLIKKNPELKKKSTPVVIHKVELEDVNALMEHAIKNKRYDFTFNKLDATIDKDDSTYTIKMEEQAFVRGLGFNLARGNYLDSHTVNSNKWILKYNSATRDLSVNKTNVVINGFRYTLDGFFHFSDSANFQLHVVTEGTPYKKVVALLTTRIRNRLGGLGIEGPINAEARIQGELRYRAQPHVVVYCSTNNNEIITPIASFTDCSFTGMFTNRAVDSLPNSDENSVVLVNNFVGSWGEIQLNADSIKLVNITKPVIKFNFFSKCNFETLNDQLSLQSVQFTGGTAQLYLQYNGPLIASTALLSKLTADIQLQNASLVYEPRDLSFTNCSGRISVSENNIAIDSFKCDMKSNHFEINVSGNNMNGLTNENLAKANIICNVFSPSVNLDDFRSVFSPRKFKSRKSNKSKMAAVASKVDDILNEGSLEMNLKASHVKLKNFAADNVQAQIFFRGNDWHVQRANLLHAGGSLVVSGAMRRVNTNYHQATANLVTENVDVRKLFYSFDNFGLKTLSYQNIRGIMNANADITFATNNNGHILPGTMQGTVDFSLRKGALINFIPAERMQEIAILKRDLSNITFDELKNKLTVHGDRIEIPRMEIASSAITMYAEGVYGLKNNTDITMQIPWSNLRQVDSAYKPTNKGVDARVGPSIWLRAVSDETGKVKIKLQLFKKRKKDKDATNSK